MSALLRALAHQAGQAIRARVREAMRRAAWLVLALAALGFTLLCATGAGYLYLATLMPTWGAALAVGGGWLAIAILALFIATRRRSVSPAAGRQDPREAIQPGLAEMQAQGAALAQRLEPEHLVVLGLVAGLAAGRRAARARDGSRDDNH